LTFATTSIDRIFAWCANNIDAATVEIDCLDEELLMGVYYPQISESPGHAPYSDEGRGAGILFWTLHTVRAYLREALDHGWEAVYINEHFTCYESWALERKSSFAQALPNVVYANLRYEAVIASTIPPLSWPPSGLAIDVKSQLAKLSASQYEKLCVQQPQWLKGDALAAVFQYQTTLLHQGRVVWGALVQAGWGAIGAQNVNGVVGEVIYDPVGLLPVAALLDNAEHVSRLCEWKSQPLSNLVRRLLDRRERAFGDDLSPFHFYYPLKISSVYLSNAYVVDGIIGAPHIPLLISDHCPGYVIPLPLALWPEWFVEAWIKVDESRKLTSDTEKR
jgi:hypothetical protein